MHSCCTKAPVQEAHTVLWLWVGAGAAGAAPESWPKGSLEVGALAVAPLLLALKSDIQS